MWGEEGKVVGCDGADMVEVGNDVKHVHVGNRVAAFMYGTQDATNGAFAEYTRYNASLAWRLLEGMTYAEATSFPIPFLTAAQNLYFRHGLRPESTVDTTAVPAENILIWGGSTAVGHHAIQLAHRSGLCVITTASRWSSVRVVLSVVTPRTFQSSPKPDRFTRRGRRLCNHHRLRWNFHPPNERQKRIRRSIYIP